MTYRIEVKLREMSNSFYVYSKITQDFNIRRVAQYSKYVRKRIKNK